MSTSMEIVANETVIQTSFWDFKGKVDYVDQWIMMSSPVPVILITVSYLAFVLKFGPDYMKKRQPFKLFNLLLVYNAVQVLVSLFIFGYGVRILWASGIVSRSCIVNEEHTNLVATGIYFYFCAKVSELLDTVFFVLRKKDNQITFLHVYHHAMMMLITWTVLKYEPTNTTVFLGTINSFVHIIMYAYYGLSTFPELAKYLWWKKYITKMQLVQFIAIILQTAANYDSRCPPSYAMFGAIVMNASLFIYLFSNFYIQAYLQQRRNTKNNIFSELNGTKHTNGISNKKLVEKVQ